MRKGLIAIGALVAALIVMVLVIVLVPRSTSGHAAPTAAVETQNRLNNALLPMADAPGVRYDGEVVVGGTSIPVKELEVTAAGDVHGKVALNNQPAEILQIAGSTYVKAPAAFWDARNADNQGEVKHQSSAAADTWSLVAPDFFGIDFGSALRPSTFALASLDENERLASSTGQSSQAQTTPADQQAPDERKKSDQDPTGLKLSAPESDGQTVQAGDNLFRLNPDGSIFGVAGTVPNQPLDRPTTNKLKVTLLTNSEVISFYSTVQGFGDVLSKVPAPEVNVPKPSGNLATCSNTFCILEYTFTNSMPGADRGTVTVQQTSTLTVNGASAGTCTRTIVMQMNGNGNSSCPFTFPAPGSGVQQINYHAESDFEISATAEKDVQVIVQAAEKGRDISTKQPGHWYPGGYKATPAARGYNQQISGVPSGFVYMVGDVPFDGREPDGTLLMTAAPGYDNHVLPNGQFDPSWAGTGELLDQAKKAKSAAGDQPLRWVFSESKSADAMQKLLADNQISGVQVVTVPAAS